MIDALFDLFGTFHQRGDLAQAEAIARSIRQAIPDDCVSLQFLGLAFYRTGRREQAIKAFKAAAACAHDRGGRAHADNTLYAATQCLRAARGHGLALSGVWYDLGLVLFRLRRYPQAIGAFQAALAGRPDFPAAQRALARSAERASRRGTGAARHEASVAGTKLAAGHGYRPRSSTYPVLQAQCVQKHPPGRSATASC
jgi:tetratricopeptide (TPR) repeat protein